MDNLKNIKVIFIDIDRTLTNNKKQVPKENTVAIKKAIQKGILVVLCSGRNIFYAEEKSKEACASPYIITNNGAQIYDYENNKSMYENTISKETLEFLLNDFKLNKIECILNCRDIRYGTRKLIRKIDNNDKFFDDFSEVKRDDILQVVGEVKSYSSMKNMVDIVSKYNDLIILNLSRTFVEKKQNESSYYADINNFTVNKGEGIKKFLELFNIKKEQALCFGDFINDIDMFNECGYKVAMGNASEELKEKADYITHSNEEAGVAYFINKYILCK